MKNKDFFDNSISLDNKIHTTNNIFQKKSVLEYLDRTEDSLRITGLRHCDHSRLSVIAVDLGLPSGTKWACCNVGACKPEEYGGYFSWGEIEEKNVYTWNTYCHCDGTEQTCYNLGCVCGTQHDVAYMKWGGAWQIPSSKQINELIDYTKYKWVELNGVAGGEFIGLNGNSIFFPAAGGKYGSKLYAEGTCGIYWTGAQGCNNNDAYAFHFDSCFANWSKCNWYRNVGLLVRPVMCSIINTPDNYENCSI